MEVIKTIYDSIEDEDERMEFINMIFRKYMTVLDKRKKERDRRLSIVEEKINRLNSKSEELLASLDEKGEDDTNKFQQVKKELDELDLKREQLNEIFLNTEQYKYESNEFYVVEGEYTLNEYCEHDGRGGQMICDGISCRCCSGFSGTHPTLFGGADKQCPCPRCYPFADSENWVRFHDYLE